MKKKILFIDQNLDGGGAERVLCTIIRSLPVDEFDISILLVGKLGDLGYLIPNHVAIHELNISNTRKALFTSILMIREIRPEVVFTTLGRTTVLAVLSKPFCPRFRLISRYANMPSREIAGGVLKGWRLFLQKLVYRYVDICVAQTEEMASEMGGILGIDSSRVRTIYNPVDTAHISEALEGESTPFCGKHINILASGRIVPQKGFDVLVEAMEELIGSNPNIHLHIIGKGELSIINSIEETAQKLGVRDNIHFHGYVRNPYPYYKFCDVFVLSSRYEGMPNVLLECMHLKVPVVATKCVPVIERLVQNGVNGYVVDVEDVEGISEAIRQALLLNSISDNHNRVFGSVGKIMKLFR